ncbi:MAG: MFS transporter [Thermoleophilia bacterium]|nr:MFS transporter [Thermoleophilia bacterium]
MAGSGVLPGRVRAQLTLATAAAVGTLYGVQGLAAALPVVQRELELSDADLGLVTAAYMVPAVLFAVPLGYLADAVGRRRVFVSMAVLWSLAGLAQAWAPGLAVLLALRFLQGIAFGALMPLSVTLIGDAVRGASQLRALGQRQVWMAIGELGMPLIGAALALLAWQASLGAQGALALLAVGGLLVLDDRPTAAGGRRYARELGAAVHQPGMPAVLAAGFLRFWCKFAILAYLPLMLVQGGAMVMQAALVLTVGSGVAALVSTQVLRLLRRAPASRLLDVAVVLVGAALVGFALAPGWEIALAVGVVYGLGDGVLMILQNALVVEGAPAGVRAGLIAVNGTARNAGKLLAPLAMAAIVALASPAFAFAAVGVSAWLALPALRPIRRFDPLLAGDELAPGARGESHPGRPSRSDAAERKLPAAPPEPRGGQPGEKAAVQGGRAGAWPASSSARQDSSSRRSPGGLENS